MRRISGTDIVSSEIALRLAEMLFGHHYGKDVTDQQLPLKIVDKGDRWEIVGNHVDIPGQRLKALIVKADGRIVELFAW
jgi:hypothetical protein